MNWRGFITLIGSHWGRAISASTSSPLSSPHSLSAAATR
jgi:hypothetical protein